MTLNRVTKEYQIALPLLNQFEIFRNKLYRDEFFSPQTNHNIESLGNSTEYDYSCKRFNVKVGLFSPIPCIVYIVALGIS